MFPAVSVGSGSIGRSSTRVFVLHAGTRLEGDDVVTAGGRVLAVTATGDTLAGAASRAYLACDAITFAGRHFRRDIAHRAL